MSKKASNPPPPATTCRPAPPPPPPPIRAMRDTFFRGLVETEESKRLTRDWQIYMDGYSHGLAVGRGKPHAPRRSFHGGIQPPEPWPRT